ncbi:hypothetical protein JCM18750_34950 [Halostagnicola bangensis]
MYSSPDFPNNVGDAPYGFAITLKELHTYGRNGNPSSRSENRDTYNDTVYSDYSLKLARDPVT